MLDDTRRVAWWLAGLALAVPALWKLLAGDHLEVLDHALIEMRTRDVFSADPPLIGAYSRFGWAHPGPVFNYLYAVPYRLFGTDSAAIHLAALTVNLLLLGWLAWLLRNAGRSVNVVMAIATVGMVATHGDLLMTDTWNPSAAVLASFVLLAAAWRATEADRGAVVSVLLAFSLVAQAHVGFAMVMLPPVVAALVISARRWWIAGHGVDHRAAWATVALAIMWLPVLVDTVRYRPGNLADLADWWIGDDEPTGGLVEGARVVARASSVSWPWRAGERTLLSTVDVGVGWLPGATIVALIAVLVLARRAQLFGVARMLAVAGLAWLGVLIGAAGVRGPRFGYLFAWLHPVVWFSYAALAIGASALGAHRWHADPRWPSTRRLLQVAGAATALVVTFAAVAGVVRAQPPGSELQAATRRFTDAIGTIHSSAVSGSPEQGPVGLAVAGGGLATGGVLFGVANALDARGITLATPGQPLEFGRRRAGATPDVTYLIALASDEALVPLDATKVTCEGELSRDDDLRRLQLRGQLTDALVAAGLGDRVSVLDTRLSAAALSVDVPESVLALQPELVELSALQQRYLAAICLFALQA